MCGRFTLKLNAKVLEDEFGIQVPPDFKFESYNIAPSQSVPIIHLDEHQEKHLSLMKWGLLPTWAKHQNDSPRPINARLETLSETPMFKSLLQQRRCLVPASGFYEWRAESKRKQPYYFHINQHPLFAFAGLWNVWEKEGEKVVTFTIITKEAEESVHSIHTRMPFVLNKPSYESWILGGDLPKKSPALHKYPVSLAVNSPQNNGPSLIE